MSNLRVFAFERHFRKLALCVFGRQAEFPGAGLKIDLQSVGRVQRRRQQPRRLIEGFSGDGFGTSFGPQKIGRNFGRHL